jgi:hypothetical protein
MKKTFITLGLLLVVAVMSAVFTEVKFSQASAPSGLKSTVATSSNPTIGTTAGILFATSTNCSSRIITTSAQPIMLTFSDNQGKVPTGSFGHLQGASTTVAYDSGIYGCNAVKVYAFASEVVTITETN